MPETLIPNSSDLNDYTTPGQYYTPNAGASSTIQNCPYTLSGFKLTVENTSSVQHVMQTLKAVNGEQVFYRAASIVSDDYQWGDWKTPVTNADMHIRLYSSPQDLNLTAGGNLKMKDVYEAMPQGSIFICNCEGTSTFSESDYPTGSSGSKLMYGILTIKKFGSNRNSVEFRQSLSAGSICDMWINVFSYYPAELKTWKEVSIN